MSNLTIKGLFKLLLTLEVLIKSIDSLNRRTSISYAGGLELGSNHLLGCRHARTFMVSNMGFRGTKNSFFTLLTFYRVTWRSFEAKTRKIAGIYLKLCVFF